LNQIRAERRRALVYGRVPLRAMPPQFWLWVALGFAVFGVVYWRMAQGALASKKAAIMAKQRSVAVALGPRIKPLRDQVEGWVRELAADYPGDFVDTQASLAELREAPGIYLRLRQASASSPKDIRRAAQNSLLDGFVSCLFVRPAAPKNSGGTCKATADCRPGELCSEWNVCGPPPRPYNMRLAYRALRVLSTEWTDELHAVDSELAASAYDRDLDSVAKHDVPIAAEIMNKARLFTLVIDEDPPGGMPAPLPEAPQESPEERVQRVAHAARVGIWDLQQKRPLLRLRAQAAADYVAVTGSSVITPETRAAQARQANSCAVALAVREKLEVRAEEAGEPGAPVQ
jgi:hypothetical protein